MTVPLERRAARVLLVDDDGRVLLQNCCDPAARELSWWNTTGGGIDDGETAPQAAARELHEETGLQVDPGQVGPVVHRRVTEFRFGGSDYRQSEEYFLVRTSAFDAEPTAHSDLETQAVLGMRWWSREELRRTVERVYPEELVDVLDRVAP
jgi:8-oxo-dGTP pyrophosphatase MutT (NUDIX family)